MTNQKQNMEDKKGYYSEMLPGRKKKVWIGVGLFLLGFFFLSIVGRDINRNPYILRSFFAPFFTLSGIIYITYSLYRKKD